MIGALDLGGTKVGVGLATPDGRLVAQSRFPTHPARGADAVLAEAVSTLRALEAEHGPISALGVGSVGPLELETGTLLSPPNFPGWSHVPLKAPLEQALGVPVRVDNDANVAALAEYRFGAGRGARTLVYATLSTGIGGGVIVEGRLLHGLGGGAGELGHQTIREGGPRCGCGNRGCLEAIASGTAIARAAREGVSTGEAAALLALAGTAEAIHAGHVAEAAAAGDAFAGRIWEAAVSAIAIGLGNVVTILAPDRLVLGGGVAQTGELLLAPLRARLAEHVRLVPVDRLKLRLAERVNDCGLLGAAALWME